MHDELIEDFALNGRVAVVTGAASGIGRETARVLAQAGAAVVLADVNQDGLVGTKGLVEEFGGRAVLCPTDVSTRSEVDALAVYALDSFGRLDIWVNCAGIIARAPMLEVTEAELDRGIAVNLKGVYWGCVAAGRAMKEAGRGSIINISSAGGDSAVPELSVYSLAKAAVNMVTRSAAKELGPFGVRANTIAPGWIDTPLGGHGWIDTSGATDPILREEGIKQRAQVSPLGLTGVPRDIALAALYLASDASRFVTGQIMRPNGGVAMP